MCKGFGRGNVMSGFCTVTGAGNLTSSRVASGCPIKCFQSLGDGRKYWDIVLFSSMQSSIRGNNYMS